MIRTVQLKNKDDHRELNNTLGFVTASLLTVWYTLADSENKAHKPDTIASVGVWFMVVKIQSEKYTVVVT